MLTNPNTPSGAHGPVRISVAYGNSPAPGLRKVRRCCSVMLLPVGLRVSCGLGYVNVSDEQVEHMYKNTCGNGLLWFPVFLARTASVCYGFQCSWPGPLRAAMVCSVPGPDRFGLLWFPRFLARTASVCYCFQSIKAFH